MNPPPPPPHGEVPKSSGLPPGKYDIFIIPEHSAGSGFLYLPSLRPNVNSFAAGFATALILVVIGSALMPAVQAWWNSVKGSGGIGIIILIFAIAIGAWALGRIQSDGGPGPGGGPSSGGAPQPETNGHAGGHQHTNSNGYANGHANGYAGGHPNGHAGGHTSGPPPQPNPPPPGAGPGPGPGPKPTWQRTAPAPEASAENPSGGTPGSTAKGAWEKAREETRKREEERKAKEAEKKRKEELEKRLKELREKEAREREAREKKKKEEEEREKTKERLKELEKEREKTREAAREATREAAREAAREKARETAREAAREAGREAAREKAKEVAKEAAKPPPSTYAFSSVGEKMSPWPKGRPPSPSPIPKPRSQPASPPKKPPPPPSARTYLGTDDDAFSFRPYDKPKRPTHQKTPSIYSESSYAASHTTSQTTPPPSQRGPYSTKDPDKIVIKAVYAFNNAFLKTPTSQLVSGVGSVTDGLILRITTEGLFIDDDVRGVPQREWDVKAWTMKLVEVWCPSFSQNPAGNSASARVSSPYKNANPVRRLWGLDKDKPATSVEIDSLLVELLRSCKNDCRLRATATAAAPSTARSYATSSVYSASSAASSAFDDQASSVSDSAYGSSVGSSSPRENLRTNRNGVNSQTGELKAARLHVLRASIRDQEGKKYVFIITEEESWKVAVGLQRLRKGSQVRALGVSGMSMNDARGTLENLGWV